MLGTWCGSDFISYIVHLFYCNMLRYRLFSNILLCFRNVFCALCNGYTLTRVIHYVRQGAGDGFKYPFSSLLAFERKFSKIEPSDKTCADGFVFDPRQVSALRAHTFLLSCDLIGCCDCSCQIKLANNCTTIQVKIHRKCPLRKHAYSNILKILPLNNEISR